MDILKAAIEYAKRGMFVIPAHHPVTRGGVVSCSCGKSHGPGKGGKHPATGWKQYQNKAPSVAQVCQDFGGRFYGYNIACIHGAPSGTVLLDWDGMEGYASQRALETELGCLPDTPTVLSGGGGSHQIYRHPGVWVPTRKALRENFDVRGDGGVSILPPSVHEFGVYQWECDKSLDDLPLGELPKPWVDFITANASNAKGPREEVQWEQVDDGSAIVTDGREVYMRDVVWGAFLKLHNELGRKPSIDELYDRALPEYMSHVDSSRPGRGVDEVWEKCSALVRKRVKLERGLSKSFMKGKR